MSSLNTENISNAGYSERVKLTTIQLRLESVRTSVNRARLAFLASTIASLSILIPAWNAYASWYRSFVMRGVPYASGGTSAVDEAQKQVISEWVKNQTITTGILGIRVGISDAAVVGAVGLLVIAIWLYFSMRRMNRTIGFLLQDTQGEDPALRKLIFHGVAGQLVFTDIGRGDQPVESLDKTPSTSNFCAARRAVKFLFYLPAVTIFIVVVLDVLSIFVLKSAFREGHQPLWTSLSNSPWWVWLQVIIWEGLAVTLGLVTTKLCRRVVAFEETTSAVIQMYDRLPASGGEDPRKDSSEE